jgi:hypothetical protein
MAHARGPLAYSYLTFAGKTADWLTLQAVDSRQQRREAWRDHHAVW